MIAEVMKEIARGCIGEEVQARLLFGTVVKENPVVVKVEERLALSEELLVIPKELKKRVVPVEGSEWTVEVDVVLIAAGFLGSQKYVTDAFKVDLTPRTNVATEAEKYQTSVKNVFTAGDMHRGQSLVVWAIHEGREAAKAVDESLMGYTNLV